jgi:hypothetical protein
MAFSPRRVASLTLLLLLGTGAHGSAQAAAKPLERRWSFSASLGKSWGHSVDQVAQVMRDARLDETTPASCFLDLCFNPIAHPIGTTNGETSMLALSYQVTRSLQLRLQRTSTDLGSTDGYNAGAGGILGGGYLTLFQSVKDVALLAGVTAGGALRLWAGPALELAHISPEDNARSTTTTVGACVRAGVTLPSRSRLFVEAAWQYDYVHPVAVGPYEVRDALSDSVIATFPRTRVSLSHHLVTVGLGVRF